jgi:stage IV sporulation protein A
MTTEPKFVPSTAANIKIDDFSTNIRLVDCVGYIVEGSKGYEDENGPRMVRTPWYDEEIPFIEAAEIGTSKVIKDHSSIGIVVTTDGSFGEIKRESYKEAEERVISELKSIGKPFIVILNSSHPEKDETRHLAATLNEEYEIPVLPISIEDINEQDIYNILKEALYEFPVLEVEVNMPDWVAALNPDYWLKEIYINKIKESVIEIDKLRDIDTITSYFDECEYIDKTYISKVDASTGIVTINLDTSEELYNKVLKEIVGIDINSRADIISLFQEYNEAKLAYDQVKDALNMVKKTGYGVANPTLSDMKLDNPEVIKQGSRYGIKLKAIAPSIHMIRVDVESTFEPIIGTEVQSKELIDHIMKDKDNVWKSEIFGRSLDIIVKEGIQAKLSLMPEGTRFKLQQVMTKLVNKGSSNLFAIVI